jgi:transcriptional regulator with GAF, ATPase, and Fis domain
LRAGQIMVNTLTDKNGGAMVVVPREDVLRSRECARDSSEENRNSRDFRLLLRASAALSSISGLASLEQPLVDLILDIIPAERGAVVLSEGTEMPTAASDDVDSCVLKRVAAESIGILVRRGPPDDRTVIAAPMLAFDKTIGVIWLASDRTDSPLDVSHLHVLIALASVAGIACENARQIEALRLENRQLRSDDVTEHDILGGSPAMREVYRWIAKVGPTDSTVLLRGETGTGKELVARGLHRRSRRAAKAFVAINCAALTETLLESELFGHERGAFTGAVALKRGKLEVADGGTVLLDEVGELPAQLQAKLLRVLQEREFERVGGTRPIKTDIRLIAATNRNLEDAVRQERWRSDLYYRLNVVSLTLPPLKQRREDIPVLAGYFAAKHADRVKRRVLGISATARACLMNYDWPGNVRELENAIERAVVLGSTDLILPEDLPETVVDSHRAEGLPIARGYHAAVREAKKQLILDAIAAAEGNCSEAARRLALHPTYLHRLITNLNIRGLVKN